jgi:hypothetical protein
VSFLSPGLQARLDTRNGVYRPEVPLAQHITPTRIVPPDFAKQSEKEFETWLFYQLKPYFSIRKQVMGRNNALDKVFRIDAVVTLIDHPDKSYGLEIKKPILGDKTIDAGHLYRQAYDYRYTDWKDYGRLPILVCPGFEGRLRTDGTANPVTDYHTFARVAGALGIGELFYNYRGALCIKFAGEHEHWYSDRGLTHDGRTWRLPGARTGH